MVPYLFLPSLSTSYVLSCVIALARAQMQCRRAAVRISILALFPATNISTLSIMFVPFVLYQVKEIPFISSCKGIVIFFKKIVN